MFLSIFTKSALELIVKKHCNIINYLIFILSYCRPADFSIERAASPMSEITREKGHARTDIPSKLADEASELLCFVLPFVPSTTLRYRPHSPQPLLYTDQEEKE
jgi:hypothetical protein